jgi:hypothetical protein
VLRLALRTTLSIIKTVHITLKIVSTTIGTVNITGLTVLTTWTPREVYIPIKESALATKFKVVKALATFMTTMATDWGMEDEPY